MQLIFKNDTGKIQLHMKPQSFNNGPVSLCSWNIIPAYSHIIINSTQNGQEEKLSLVSPGLSPPLPVASAPVCWLKGTSSAESCPTQLCKGAPSSPQQGEAILLLPTLMPQQQIQNRSRFSAIETTHQRWWEFCGRAKWCPCKVFNLGLQFQNVPCTWTIKNIKKKKILFSFLNSA